MFFSHNFRFSKASRILICDANINSHRTQLAPNNNTILAPVNAVPVENPIAIAEQSLTVLDNFAAAGTSSDVAEMNSSRQHQKRVRTSGYGDSNDIMCHSDDCGLQIQSSEPSLSCKGPGCGAVVRIYFIIQFFYWVSLLILIF